MTSLSDGLVKLEQIVRPVPDERLEELLAHLPDDLVYGYERGAALEPSSTSIMTVELRALISEVKTARAAIDPILLEIKRMREALRPFADAIKRYEAHWNEQTGNQPWAEDDSEAVEFMGWLGDYFPLVTLGDFRRALSTLSPQEPDNG
jgi:hypothetical protein